MTRYIKQRDNFSCVPVTILNARKWLGQRVSYARDYWKCRALAGCYPGYGAGGRGFLRAARDLPMTRVYLPTLEKIDDAVKAGNAVILRARWPEQAGITGHIFLITRRTDRSLFCINVYGGHQWRHKSLFPYHYLTRVPGAPAAWIIQCPSSPKPKNAGCTPTSQPSPKSFKRRRPKGKPSGSQSM